MKQPLEAIRSAFVAGRFDFTEHANDVPIAALRLSF